jgi:multiple sugar transport system substrate-binding protein
MSDPAGTSGLPGISRRDAIKGLGVVAASATLGSANAGRVSAQGPVTLRWWSPQSAPAQLAAYRAQIASFEAAHPGTKVNFEPTSDEGYPAQLSAAFAAKQVPNILTHLPSFAVSNYWRNGLVEPFNDVIQALGPQNYYEGANRVYEIDKGQFAGTGIGNTAANMLWVRRDLMARAGIDKIPETWDELRSACRKLQTGGIYGAPLPYARNSMTSLIFISMIHLGGGQVFTPDLQVAINSDAVVNALDFYRSMRELCPPGATNYSWGESLTAFVSGATATGIYAGRVLANVNSQNPAIADQITCRTYPRISRDVKPWTFNDFPSVFIPKGASNLKETKMFAAWLFQPEGYIQQLHAAPGHVLPVLKTIAQDPRYLANPLIKKYAAEVDLMAASAAAGHNLGWETDRHRPNTKAGAIVASHVIAELVQKVVLNNENPRQTLGDTARRLEELMKS